MNRKASPVEILRMFAILNENLGEGINHFPAKTAQGIIKNGSVCGENLMGFLEDGARPAFRKNFPPFFAVTSDGRAPSDISGYLKERGSTVGPLANGMILHPDFSTTNGITYIIGILFGHEFSDEERTNEGVEKKGETLGWDAPPAETGYLARLKISDQNMRELSLERLIMMHKSIPDSDGVLSRFTLTRNGRPQWLGARPGRPGAGWKKTDGFGFLIPQIGNEK